ncbi:hypothetical protein RCL1_001799 [Eukaryota sp. TZLM3-RCL]
MDSNIALFIDIFPDVPIEVAQHFLSMANGDLETAIGLYAENPVQTVPSQAPQPPEQRPQQPARSTPPVVPSFSSPSQFPPQQPSRRVATLSDFSSQSCSGKSCSSCPGCPPEKGEEEQWFVGHGDKATGELLLAPKTEKPLNPNPLDALIEAAKQAPHPSPSSPQPPSSFQGAGYRLGDTALNPPQSFRQQPTSLNEGPIEFPIALYRNGILVDEQHFFPFSDPSTHSMVETMLKSEMPPEIEKMAREKAKQRGGPMRAREINVQLSDNRQEDYEPPKPKFEPFKGGGLKLGDGPVGEPVRVVAQAPKVEEKPLTQGDLVAVKVRLANGQSQVVKISRSQRISELYNQVQRLSGVSSFSLHIPGPQMPALDLGLSISDAGIANGVVIQKKK